MNHQYGEGFEGSFTHLPDFLEYIKNVYIHYINTYHFLDTSGLN